MAIMSCASYDSPVEFEDISADDIKEIEQYIRDHHKSFIETGLLKATDLSVYSSSPDIFRFRPGDVRKLITIGQHIKKLGPQKFLDNSEPQNEIQGADKDAKKLRHQILQYFMSNYEFDISNMFLISNIQLNKSDDKTSAQISCPFCPVKRKILKDQRHQSNTWSISNYTRHFVDVHKSTVLGNREKQRPQKTKEKPSKKRETTTTEMQETSTNNETISTVPTTESCTPDH